VTESYTLRRPSTARRATQKVHIS